MSYGFAQQYAPASQATWIAPTGTFCSVCLQPQFSTQHGDTCANGHGGAPAAIAPAAAFVAPEPEPFGQYVRHEISPSQVSTFAECERKWAWEKLDRIEVPQKNSAKVGERVHAILEAWLQFATPPDQTEELVLIDERTNQPVTYYPGKIAAAGLHHLPPPGPHLEIERWIHPPMLTVERGFWNGRVDCAHDLLGDPELIDHKTTTDLKWAKTPEVLRTDAQALIYAWAAIHATGKSAAHLRWIYYQSRKPFKTYVSYTRMSRDETLEGLAPWEAKADRMIKLKVAGKKALDLEPNPDVCDRFGGCPHRLRCSLTPNQLMRSVFAMNDLSLEARIDAAARAAGQAQAPAYPGGFAGNPQLPYQQPQGYAQPGPQTAMQYPQQQPQQYAQQQPQQYAQQPQMQMPQQPQGAPVQFAQSAPAQEIRPSFPTPWQPHSTAPGWEARQVLDANGQVQWEQRPVQMPQVPSTPMQGQVSAAAPVAQGLNPPESAGQPVHAAPPQQQATEEHDESKVGDQFDGMELEALKNFAQMNGLEGIPPRLRTKNLRIAVRNAWRDKQSGVIAPQVPQAQAQQIPQQMQAPQMQQPPQPQMQAPQQMPQAQQTVMAAATTPAVQQPFGATAARRGFTLFVNCVPQKTTRRVLTLAEAFGDCFSLVARDANVPDYRMVEHYQGAPRVCVQIRSKQNVAPLADDAIVVISTLSQEGKDVYGTLAELAGEVVVGSAA